MSKTSEKNSEPDSRTTVVNLRKEDYDVYIGRAGRGQDGYFGNPHPIGYCRVCDCTHDRRDSIEAYQRYFFERIYQDREFKERILSLRGKKLGCFCKPLACHGDVIAAYVDVRMCHNCGESIAEPSNENLKYRLCDACIACSIIGYDAKEESK